MVLLLVVPTPQAARGSANSGGGLLLLLERRGAIFRAVGFRGLPRVSGEAEGIDRIREQSRSAPGGRQVGPGS